MTRELKTLEDFTRFAMSEMERSNVSLGHGSEDLWQEATTLVLRTLSLPFDRLETFWHACVTDKEARELLRRIRARCDKKTPLAYLLKEAWFTNFSFYVDERVLIPRSFIAELLEESLSPWVKDPESVTSVLDLCTGSGCLAILSQIAFPNAAVTGADISKDALEVAKINRTNYDMDETLELIRSDLFKNLKNRRFDVIISNPPYVTIDAMKNLPAEYRQEPSLALEAGVDGMSVIEKMMPELKNHLTEDGLAVIELGDGQEAFEVLYPTLPVTWLTTSGGEAMVFCVTRQDLDAYFA